MPDTNDILKQTGIEIEGGEALEELEKKFQAISASAPIAATAAKAGMLSEKKAELEKLLDRISKDLASLKTKVKGDLDNLKKLKDAVEQELVKVKNLEATKTKVEAEIEKVIELEKNEENLSKEVAELEKEVG